MNKPVRATVFFIILLYSLGFLTFLIISILTFPEDSIHRHFFIQWIFDNSLHRLIDACFALQITAVVLVFSLIVSFSKLGVSYEKREIFLTITRNLVFAFAVFTLLYAFLVEVVQPGFYRRENERTKITKMVREFEETANRLYKEDRYEEALTYIEYYEKYIPSGSSIGELKSNIIKSKSEHPKTDESPEYTAGSEERLYRGTLLNTAERYYENGEYHSAYYYAVIANLATDNNAEAEEIARKAWAKIQTNAAPEKADQESIRFGLKQQAYEELHQGDPVKAYYLFESLAEKYPNDPDISKYLKRAEEKLHTKGFFKDEIDRLAWLPPIRDISFVNGTPSDKTETIHIEKMYRNNGTFYFEGIDIITSDGAEEGEQEIFSHITAPYGKYMDGAINLLCLGRDSENYYGPMYVKKGKENTLRYSVELSVPPTYLHNFSSEQRIGELGLPELWELRSLIQSGKIVQPSGTGEIAISNEILFRFIRIFSFFVLSLAIIPVARRLRTKEGKKPTLSLLFIPVFPLVLYRLIEIYLYGQRLLFGRLFLLLDFLPSILLLILFQGVLLLFGMLFLAKQTHNS